MSGKTSLFHEAVYSIIQQIPHGEVATYRYIGEIAENFSNITLPYPEIEAAYVVNAHELEHPFHRVVYTYIMFRNDRQKSLLIHEKAIDVDLRLVKYWKSPLESEDLLNRAYRMALNGKEKFKSLQEYFYYMHEIILMHFLLIIFIEKSHF